MSEPASSIFGFKLATILSSMAAAGLSVALEWKKHSALTAIGSVFAGVFVAVIATGATVGFFGFEDENWSRVIAACYGITGRNLIIWLRDAANDPPKVVRDFLKGGGK